MPQEQYPFGIRPYDIGGNSQGAEDYPFGIRPYNSPEPEPFGESFKLPTPWAPPTPNRPIEEQPGLFGGFTESISQLGKHFKEGTDKTLADYDAGNYGQMVRDIVQPFGQPWNEAMQFFGRVATAPPPREGPASLQTRMADLLPILAPGKTPQQVGQLGRDFFLGGAGFPTNGAVEEAWNTGNYPRLAGQTASALAQTFGPWAYTKFRGGGTPIVEEPFVPPPGHGIPSPPIESAPPPPPGAGIGPSGQFSFPFMQDESLNQRPPAPPDTPMGDFTDVGLPFDDPFQQSLKFGPYKNARGRFTTTPPPFARPGENQFRLPYDLYDPIPGNRTGPPLDLGPTPTMESFAPPVAEPPVPQATQINLPPNEGPFGEPTAPQQSGIPDSIRNPDTTGLPPIVKLDNWTNDLFNEYSRKGYVGGGRDPIDGKIYMKLPGASLPPRPSLVDINPNEPVVVSPQQMRDPSYVRNLQEGGMKLVETLPDGSGVFKMMTGEEGSTSMFDPNEWRIIFRRLLGREPTTTELQDAQSRAVMPGEATGRVAQFPAPTPPPVTPGNAEFAQNPPIPISPRPVVQRSLDADIRTLNSHIVDASTLHGSSGRTAQARVYDLTNELHDRIDRETDLNRALENFNAISVIQNEIHTNSHASQAHRTTINGLSDAAFDRYHELVNHANAQQMTPTQLATPPTLNGPPTNRLDPDVIRMDLDEAAGITGVNNTIDLFSYWQDQLDGYRRDMNAAGTDHAINALIALRDRVSNLANTTSNHNYNTILSDLNDLLSRQPNVSVAPPPKPSAPQRIELGPTEPSQLGLQLENPGKMENRVGKLVSDDIVRQMRETLAANTTLGDQIKRAEERYKRDVEYAKANNRPIPPRPDATNGTWDRWAREQLAGLPDGTPGIGVHKPYSFSETKQITYRGPDGKPIATVKVSERPDGSFDIPTLAVDRNKPMLASKAMFEILLEALKMGAGGAKGIISEHTYRLVDHAVKLIDAYDATTFGEGKFRNPRAPEEVSDVPTPRPDNPELPFNDGESGFIDTDLLLALPRALGRIIASAKYLNPLAGKWATALHDLDVTKAPDSEYRNILSTDKEQKPLSTGETWRGRVQKGIKFFESLYKDETGAKPISDLVNMFKKKRTIGQEEIAALPEEEGKQVNILKEAINLTSSATTTMDLSASGRQALPTIFTPEFWRAQWPQLKAAMSENNFNKIDAELKANKIFNKRRDEITGKVVKSVAEEAGLKLMTRGEKPGAKEESVASKWIETGGSVPFLSAAYRHSLGIPARMSNRAFTTLLNHIRVNRVEKMFDLAANMSNTALETGKARANIFKKSYTPEQALDLNPYKNPMLAKEIVDYVNTVTGRAPLKTQIPFTNVEVSVESMANKLAYVLFAPRQVASRIRMLNPSTYMFATPFVRRQYLKSAVSMAAAWYGMAQLAQLSPDVEVSDDIDSADYGKIRIGNTRLDPGAGFQQFLVMLHRLYSGNYTSSSSGISHRYGSGYQAETQFDAGERLFMNKLNPAAKYVADWLSASEHQPFHVGDRTVQLFTPLILQDMYELYKEDPKLMPQLALPVMFGMGTQIYSKGETPSKIVPQEYDWNITGGGIRDMIPLDWQDKLPAIYKQPSNWYD